MRKLGGIILAAGKGTRFNSQNLNKVVFPIANKPIIVYGVNLLQKLEANPIIVVVWFARESVERALKNMPVVFARQRKRSGTARAVSCALAKLPTDIPDVLVLQGDDCAFYKEKTIRDLVGLHRASSVGLTFLTIELENPYGLGRVVRDASGNLLAIVEQSDATDAQKRIKEVNPACYVFRVTFLKKYLREVKRSKVTGEYYLTNLIDVAIKHGEKIATLRRGKMPWRGVNTKEELREAEMLWERMHW